MSKLKNAKSKLLLFILASLILGAILGMIVSSAASEATTAKLIAISDPVGKIFIRLLKMIVMPELYSL